MDMAKLGNIDLFFMDASHFVMGGFLGRGWSRLRHWVKTSSGRQRFNVLGTLNFITKKVEMITNDTYITSTQVVELFKILTNAYSKPIVVVLDNAPYQTCKFVKEAAKRLGIGLAYLPTYSPNLNLIERVWKLVKSKVLSLVYHETFDQFCESITNCVKTLHTTLLPEMNSRITDKFHILDSKNIA